MKIQSLLIGSTALVLSACMQSEPLDAPNVVAPVVGKELVSRGGASLMIKADGTISGMVNGIEINGTYTASGTEICSTITSPAEYAGERCSVPVYEEDTVIFNRRDGSQSALYTIGS